MDLDMDTPPFRMDDLRAMRELLPPEREEKLKDWIGRCVKNSLLGPKDAEMIRTNNPAVWETPYAIEPPRKKKPCVG
jgi:hypothetical protein